MNLQACRQGLLQGMRCVRWQSGRIAAQRDHDVGQAAGRPGEALQVGRGHQPVTAIVAGTTGNPDAPGVRGQSPGVFGHAEARAGHQCVGWQGAGGDALYRARRLQTVQRFRSMNADTPHGDQAAVIVSMVPSNEESSVSTFGLMLAMSVARMGLL
ncbi:hypothetical protein FQZ97_967030 [compost metagenome]